MLHKEQCKADASCAIQLYTTINITSIINISRLIPQLISTGGTRHKADDDLVHNILCHTVFKIK